MIEGISPEIKARWIASDLSVNDLHAVVWDTAPPVLIERLWSGESVPASRHTEVRILWSEQAMHARFVCRQQEPFNVNHEPQTNHKTLGLWNRDVCEIFLAPNADQPEHYFEFEVAPTGEWIDLEILWDPEGRMTDWDFNSGITVATSLESEVLTVAMRIPWGSEGRSIPKPHQGDVWRTNLFRCAGEGNSRYLAWQPTFTEEPNFHEPEVFGWLRFE